MVGAFIKYRMEAYPNLTGREYTETDARQDNEAGWHGNLTLTGLGSGASATIPVDIAPLTEPDLRQGYIAAQATLDQEESSVSP